MVLVRSYSLQETGKTEQADCPKTAGLRLCVGGAVLVSSLAAGARSHISRATLDSRIIASRTSIPFTAMTCISSRVAPRRVETLPPVYVVHNHPTQVDIPSYDRALVPPFERRIPFQPGRHMLASFVFVVEPVRLLVGTALAIMRVRRRRIDQSKTARKQ